MQIMKTFDYQYIEQNDLIDCRTNNLNENNLNLIERTKSERRMKLLDNFKIETDEDYQELGEMFSEDE